MDSKDRCYHCGANMRAYWHPMSPRYVSSLIKMLKVVKAKNENHVELKECGLTNSEYANITKLRFFGLIAKYETASGVRRGWLITRLGGQFLRGEGVVPDKVKTFRNRITEKSEITISIHDVMRNDNEWPQTFESEIMKGAK